MNEIALSNNLSQIEYEIRNHKAKIGESLWEIGRRLKHVKENNLAHGQFLDWVESVGIARNEAQKYIKIVDELSPNYETFNNLGLSALYLIATLPDEQKSEQLERIERGDNPTVRELQEVKRQLKLAEADNTRLKQQNENLAEQALANLGKTVTKEVVKEVVPDDYKATKQLNNSLLNKNKELSSELEHAQDSAEYYRQQLEELQNERLAVNEKSAKYEELTRAIEASRGQLNAEQAKISSHKNLVAYLRKGNELLTSMGGIIYLNDEAYLKSNNQLLSEFNLLKDGINRLADELNRMTSQADIIEGDIL